MSEQIPIRKLACALTVDGKEYVAVAEISTSAMDRYALGAMADAVGDVLAQKLARSITRYEIAKAHHAAKEDSNG